MGKHGDKLYDSLVKIAIGKTNLPNRRHQATSEPLSIVRSCSDVLSASINDLQSTQNNLKLTYNNEEDKITGDDRLSIWKNHFQSLLNNRSWLIQKTFLSILYLSLM